MSDLIRRQAALDALKGFDVEIIPYEHGKMYVQETLNAIHHRLSDLPSAEPNRKRGKWIEEKINSYTSRTYCSECENSAPFICVSGDHYGRNMHGETNKTKFCPNCGAKMDWSDDE